MYVRPEMIFQLVITALGVHVADIASSFSSLSHSILNRVTLGSDDRMFLCN